MNVWVECLISIKLINFSGRFTGISIVKIKMYLHIIFVPGFRFRVSDYDYYLRLQDRRIKIFLHKIQILERYRIKEYFTALQLYSRNIKYEY